MGKAKPKVILATDLDGTFLGGSAEDRKALYAWIAENRSHVTLVYATGRSYRDTKVLLGTIPMPDYFICNAGGTVQSADGSYEDAVQGVIDTNWGPERQMAVAELMRGEAGVTEQVLRSMECRRVSYDYDSETARVEVIAQRLIDNRFNPIISHGKFLDVLPEGVSKGSSLERLLDANGLSDHLLLVAGDTMNDHSLFVYAARRNSPAILVANADHELRTATAGYANIIRSAHHGAGAILDVVTPLLTSGS